MKLSELTIGDVKEIIEDGGFKLFLKYHKEWFFDNYKYWFFDMCVDFNGTSRFDGRWFFYTHGKWFCKKWGAWFCMYYGKWFKKVHKDLYIKYFQEKSELLNKKVERILKESKNVD